MSAGGDQRVRVWDPFVRAFHWSLAAVFALAWATPRASETWHARFGYLALLLVAARIVWGFVGPGYARFSHFVRSPGRTLRYLGAIAAGTEARHLGHNPAGGAMIVVLLIGVIAAVATGWVLTTDAYWGSQAAAKVHGIVVHGVLALVLLHLVGVAVASYRHRENLPRAMATGVKRAAGRGDVA